MFSRIVLALALMAGASATQLVGNSTEFHSYAFASFKSEFGRV